MKPKLWQKKFKIGKIEIWAGVMRDFYPIYSLPNFRISKPRWRSYPYRRFNFKVALYYVLRVQVTINKTTLQTYLLHPVCLFVIAAVLRRKRGIRTGADARH
jgi:hypothetical protein